MRKEEEEWIAGGRRREGKVEWRRATLAITDTASLRSAAAGRPVSVWFAPWLWLSGQLK